MTPRPTPENLITEIAKSCEPISATHIEDIDTPAVVVDLDTTVANILRFQAYCDDQGLHFRPHIKTHKIPALARAQLAAGAVGINCQKISEAEVMADAGLDDILITYNILGAEKLARLRKLAERCAVRVTADNAVVVDGLARTMATAPSPLGVLVECDTGTGRCGVQTPESAVELAAWIAGSDGLEFLGLMTYPPAGGNTEADAWLAHARNLCESNELPCLVISSGGSPDMWGAKDLKAVTEYRVGTYIYNDRSLVARGTCTPDQCALHVLATVVSRPTDDRAIVDAGSKSLTSDNPNLGGFGTIPEMPGATIYALNEEHGYMDVSAVSPKPKVGDKVRIVPNHVCVVSNLVDRVHAVRGTRVIGTLDVAARGCSY